VAFAEVLASLSRTLDPRSDPALMRTTFEEGLRQTLPVRSVQLRDAASWRPERAEGGIGVETMALDVPVREVAFPAVLEATYDLAAGLGEWEVQLLSDAAHVGALVLEIERIRTRLAGVLSAPKPRRDGAAPLIGSTPTMQTLRLNIELVAGTDFTVLLEGESGR
jgi:hypothetical protein